MMRTLLVALTLCLFANSAFADTPCDQPRQWRHRIQSKKFPFWVHYKKPAHKRTAKQVVRMLDSFWELETIVMGFSPPLPDGGQCGPDGGFDIFLWPGHIQCYVDVFAENPATEWDDGFAYMVLDPWGPYGGEFLRSTVSHEFNHALQAADDWWDHALVYEMTAQFIEWVAAGRTDIYLEVLTDFQKYPDWSLDYNDNYDTWYMYGAALYLHFLRDRYFDGNVQFISQMWAGMRNPPGNNEPDFEDALDAILPIPFLQTVPEFAKWRWYSKSRNDGNHFQGNVLIPDVKLAANISLGATSTTLTLDPMALGSSYVQFKPASENVSKVKVTWSAQDPSITWVVQALPGLGGSDGDIIESGAELDWIAGKRALVVTALSSVDPDERDAAPDQRFPIELTLTPVP